jgi:sec-independent protein translocase protein TatA
MPNIGPLELGIVLVIALVVLGPKKLPDLGRSMGRGIREFKGSLSGDSTNDGVDTKRAGLDEVSHANGESVVGRDRRPRGAIVGRSSQLSRE